MEYKVLVDADACPVINQTIKICQKYKVPCLLVCDDSHFMQKDGAETITVSKGADSVDFALVNRVKSGDIVITQDYGLAAMSLSKGATVLHQDGFEYDSSNIQGLLMQRHINAKIRRNSGRTKGPKKRSAEQDNAFLNSLETIVKEKSAKEGVSWDIN